MGVDPGLARTGWGMLESNGADEHCLGWGAITTPSGESTQSRLGTLYRKISEIISSHRPTAVAVEDIIHSPRAQSLYQVGHARGVVLLAAAQQDVDVFEYGPTAVKLAVVGYGKAEKAQVAQMVKVLLNLSEVPRPPDAADALAVAICHLHSLDYPGETID
jgi:crossover junction endodeoxyribonuclease RuvC